MQPFILIAGKIEELISPNLQAKWREQGFDLRSALNTASLDLVKTKAPALVIAEINMQEISGWEILEYVKSFHTAKKVPFVFVSDSPNAEEENKALAQGVNAYLSRPVDQQILEKKANEIFSILSSTETRPDIGGITKKITKKRLAGGGTRQIKLSTGVTDTLHMRLSHLYSEETKISHTKQPVSSDIFQRLLVSLSLISVDDLNKASQEQVQRKLKGEEGSLEDVLIEKGLLSQDVLKNLKYLKKQNGESLIPGYTVEKLLGEGGIAAVYLGTKDDSGEQVAIKVFAPPLSDTSSGVVRFIRECEVIKSLNHPNIVKAYDFGDFHGLYYMAMEYLEGITLTEQIINEGVIEEQEALEIVEKVVQGLQSAWNKGFIHRDIKPDNIMVGENLLRICDFGLAKSLDASMDLTRAGVIVGTPHYMAPEQFTGEELDYRTDVYALGVTLYVMLTGHLPFAGKTTMALQDSHLSSPPPLPSAFDIQISKGCEAFLFKLLSKDKDDRCVNTAQLFENIQRAKKGLHPLGGVKYFQQMRRKRILRIGILLCILAFIGGSIWYAMNAEQTAEIEKKTAKVQYKKKIIEQKKKTEEEGKKLEKKSQQQQKKIEEKKKKLLEEARKKKLAQKIKKRREAFLKQRMVRLGLRQIRKAMKKLNLVYALQEITKLEYKYPSEAQIGVLKKIIQNLSAVNEALAKKHINNIWAKVKKLDQKSEYIPLLYLLLQRHYLGLTPAEKLAIFPKWLGLSDKAKGYLMKSIQMDLDTPWMQKHFFALSSEKAKFYFAGLQKWGGKEHSAFVVRMQNLRHLFYLLKNISSNLDKLEDFVKKHPQTVAENLNFVYAYLSREDKLVFCKMVPKLAQRGDLKSLPLLIGKLDGEGDVPLRILLAKNLCSAKHTLCDGALVKMLSDSSPVIRSQSIESLGKRKLFNFLHVVTKDKELSVRKKLIRVLKKSGKSLATETLLIRTLEDPNANIREKSAEILGKWKSRIALKPLLKRLSDENSDVVKKSVWALGRLKNPATVSPLMKTLHFAPDMAVHGEIIKTLGNVHTKESFQSLLKILKEYPFYKQTASTIASGGLDALPVVLDSYKKAHHLLYKRQLESILMKIGAKVIPLLSSELLSTQDIALQKSLIQILGSLGKKAAVPTLINLLKRKAVKWYARRALRQISENLSESSPLRKKIEDILES